MPPRKYSRYTFTTGILDEEERLSLTEREPYRFQPFADNRMHIAQEGDSLFTLAGKYFRGLPRPNGLWWVLADFQPEPVLDPTIVLTPGRVVYIPSMRTVLEKVFAETRRAETSEL